MYPDAPQCQSTDISLGNALLFFRSSTYVLTGEVLVIDHPDISTKRSSSLINLGQPTTREIRPGNLHVPGPAEVATVVMLAATHPIVFDLLGTLQHTMSCDISFARSSPGTTFSSGGDIYYVPIGFKPGR